MAIRIEMTAISSMIVVVKHDRKPYCLIMVAVPMRKKIKRYRNTYYEDINRFSVSTFSGCRINLPNPTRWERSYSSFSTISFSQHPHHLAILFPEYFQEIPFFAPNPGILSNQPISALRSHRTDHNDKHDTSERDHHIDNYVKENRVRIVSDD